MDLKRLKLTSVEHNIELKLHLKQVTMINDKDFDDDNIDGNFSENEHQHEEQRD